MISRSPIPRLLLAIVLAFSPSVCLCPPKTAVAVSARCALAPAASKPGCCRSGGSGTAERAFACGAKVPDGAAPGGGCERCGGSCRCKAAPSMKGEVPRPAHLFAPAAPAVFAFIPPPAERSSLTRVVQVASGSVPGPVTTLLRQRCALII
ncbi:MAG: hypothetical protein JNM07_13665 [Phycisphaerae bacterium]|nr:hypothetical protein [Phycisphaerae bacterium]